MKYISIGMMVGRLEVLGVCMKRYKDRRYVAAFCKCQCGGFKTVLASNLLGRFPTLSCGCVLREVTRQRSTRHGFKTRKNTHPIYNTWRQMIRRCENPMCRSFKDYGGRGIAVSEEWYNFETFMKDMLQSWKSGLSIERVDNSKGYSKDNCIWADSKIQNRNKRNTHLLTLNGETLPISAWAERLHPENMDFIYVRLKRGWTPEQALTIPIGENRPQYRGRWPVKSA